MVISITYTSSVLHIYSMERQVISQQPCLIAMFLGIKTLPPIKPNYFIAVHSY
jgi:hypothetical protein